MAEAGDDSLPVELEDVLVNYGNAVADLDTYLQPLINANFQTIHVCDTVHYYRFERINANYQTILLYVIMGSSGSMPTLDNLCM